MNIQKFKAIRVEQDEIILENNNDIEKVYELITSEYDFILEWKEEETIKSELFMGTNLLSKVKNGEIKIKSYSKIKKRK